MSDEAKAWVKKNSPFTGIEYFVHYMMGDLANSDNNYEIWAGDEWFAKQCRVSVKTIQRVRTKLLKAGLLKKVSTATARGQNLRYRLTNGGHTVQRSIDQQWTHSPSTVDKSESSPLINQSELKEARKRARNPVFEALCEVSGIDWKNSNPTELGPINKATASLRKMATVPTEDEIHAAARRYKATWPNLDFSAMALVKNWTRFAQITVENVSGPTKAEREALAVCIYDEWNNSSPQGWTVPGTSATMKTHPKFSGWNDPREKGTTNERTTSAQPETPSA